jgi:hypothetical protein
MNVSRECAMFFRAAAPQNGTVRLRQAGHAANVHF